MHILPFVPRDGTEGVGMVGQRVGQLYHILSFPWHDHKDLDILFNLTWVWVLWGKNWKLDWLDPKIHNHRLSANSVILVIGVWFILFCFVLTICLTDSYLGSCGPSYIPVVVLSDWCSSDVTLMNWGSNYLFVLRLYVTNYIIMSSFSLVLVKLHHKTKAVLKNLLAR